ncbi:hypothetical protein F4781DRAFT_443096 [Annulohypoxylon bovei var. microspora]|nr:hypothetical protein F4781DRAFT_443096 [Annulohypoxylon bovei var. microspora]
MPTAPGSFTWDSANRVTATFFIEDILHSFTANINPSLPPFTSNDVVMTYNEPKDLTSTRSFTGKLGPINFKISLENDVIFEGKLNQPGIPTGVTLNGSGAWIETVSKAGPI